MKDVDIDLPVTSPWRPPSMTRVIAALAEMTLVIRAPHLMSALVDESV